MTLSDLGEQTVAMYSSVHVGFGLGMTIWGGISLSMYYFNII